MDYRTLAIPLGFILLAALLCWWVIGTKGAWWKKLLAIVLVPTFGLAIWRAIPTYLGWPSPQEPPMPALLLWGGVREPEPQDGDRGAILLLLRPLSEQQKDGLIFLGYKDPHGEPRIYKLPYSRRLHERMQRAGKMMRDGRQVVIDLRGGRKGGRKHGRGDGSGDEGDEDGIGEGDGDEADGDGGPPGYGYDPNRRDFQIYELPPPHPPRKIPE